MENARYYYHQAKQWANRFFANIKENIQWAAQKAYDGFLIGLDMLNDFLNNAVAQLKAGWKLVCKVFGELPKLLKRFGNWCLDKLVLIKDMLKDLAEFVWNNLGNDSWFVWNNVEKRRRIYLEQPG